jgi:general secretion pathway protein C
MLNGLRADRLWSYLSSPAAVRLSRYAAIALSLLWIAASVMSAIDVWRSPRELRSREAQALGPVNELAPLSTAVVDIDAMVSVPLFGLAPTDADELMADGVTAEEVRGRGGNNELDGIENDAEETRLPLQLVGAIDAKDAALDRAVIETAQTQAQYFVGDALPLDRRVVVAKILSDRVVLDNEGNYELLRLFDERDQVPGLVRRDRAAEDAADEARRAAALASRNRSIRQLAAAQRRGSGPAPASLSDIINIAVANDGGVLAGYRVSAARDEASLEALGFREGDIITSIDGQSLSDPSRGMLLYRALRSSGSARYGILRDGAELSLSVGGSQSLEE